MGKNVHEYDKGLCGIAEERVGCDSEMKGGNQAVKLSTFGL